MRSKEFKLKRIWGNVGLGPLLGHHRKGVGGGIWSEWAGGETLQLLKANFCKSGGPLKCY